MVDVGSVQAFMTSITAAASLARELTGVVVDRAASEKLAEVNAKILEAQSFALATQADQLALSEQVRKLESELEGIRDFREEKKNYEPKSIGGTAYVYAYKDSPGSSVPAHWLCSSCFDRDKKSTLQFFHQDIGRGPRRDVWRCHLCEAEIRVGSGTVPEFE